MPCRRAVPAVLWPMQTTGMALIASMPIPSSPRRATKPSTADELAKIMASTSTSGQEIGQLNSAVAGDCPIGSHDADCGVLRSQGVGQIGRRDCRLRQQHALSRLDRDRRLPGQTPGRSRA